MMNLFLWATLFVLSVSLFQLSFSYGLLARTFASVDVTLLQEAVATNAGKDEEYIGPFFDEGEVEKLVGARFACDLGDRHPTIACALSFSYGDYCLSDRYPRRVVITLKGESALLHYSDSKAFRLVRGSPDEQ